MFLIKKVNRINKGDYGVFGFTQTSLLLLNALEHRFLTLQH